MMTEDEYKRENARIDKEAQQMKAALAYHYAIANSPAKRGDTVKDHLCTIIVRGITVTMRHGLPKCLYNGPKIKASGERWKSGAYDDVYQSNILKVNGVDV